MDLRRLMFFKASSGSKDDGNLVDMKEFSKNTNITVNGNEVVGTINNLRDSARKYMLKKTIPSGTKVKCSVEFYCEQNETSSGGLIFRLKYKDSDSSVNVYTMLNSYSEWTPNNGTVTLQQDADGIEYGWTNGPTNIMHMRDIKVEIVQE